MPLSNDFVILAMETPYTLPLTGTCLQAHSTCLAVSSTKRPVLACMLQAGKDGELRYRGNTKGSLTPSFSKAW